MSLAIPEGVQKNRNQAFNLGDGASEKGPVWR